MLSKTDTVFVWTTLSKEDQAQSLAEMLVEEGLAACVHIFPQGRSIYKWQGKIQHDLEWTLLIKTRRDLYDTLEKQLLALHPYELPEILLTPVEHGLPGYVGWLMENTRSIQ